MCLEPNPPLEPLGLYDLSPDERETFTGSVNSQLKAPNTTGQRDGQHRDISGARKMSFSQGHNAGNVSSPLSARPFGRRRDTNESFPFPKDSGASPSATKLSKDDPLSGLPAPLVRRRTDLKDASSDRGSGEGAQENEEDTSSGPFGLSRRMSGPLSAGLNGPASPWSIGGLGPGPLGSANAPTTTQRRPGAASRSESRFKNLMHRESMENASGLGTLNEDVSRRQGNEDRTLSRESDHDPQGRPVGSAALGGAHDDGLLNDLGPQNFGITRTQTYPERSSTQFQLGAESSFMDQRSPFQNQHHSEEPSSPTYTNPYQSPEHNPSKLNDYGTGDLDMSNLHLPGLGGMSSAPGMRGSSAFDASPLDRNQALPSATQRGFTGLGGLGTLPATNNAAQWPTSLESGTPGRDHAFSGFGDTRGSSEGLQGHAFPGLGGLGSYGMEGLNDSGKGPNANRLGSLFPSGMQEQMSGHEASHFAERSRGGYDPFSARPNELNGPPRGAFSGDRDSSYEQSQAHLHEALDEQAEFPDPQAEGLRQRYSPEGLSGQRPAGSHIQRRTSTDYDQPGSQPPAAQQKTMVMPDRIRWIYRDPQGKTQGPWSGLEMHDWYRAGFFSPELLVKKVEDADYEPLAQLIRRIGNSREPFLVPQIGIPGPPSGQASWPVQPPPPTAPTTTSSAPSAQPPFASSFPSFGTTLTAEQQNALERRKQEEQYLMARQKEHLAQQQLLAKQRSVPGSAGLQNLSQQQSLQHHSSVQSLQSQPSYGSMAAQGGGSSNNRAFSGAFGQGAGPLSSNFDRSSDEQEDSVFARLEPNQQGVPDVSHLSQEHHAFSEAVQDDERIANMLADRAHLQEQAEAEQLMREQSNAYGVDADRLQQFHHLRQQGQHELPQKDSEQDFAEQRFGIGYRTQGPSDRVEHQEHKLTLTEQVQKAASSKQSPSSASNSPWANKIDKPIAESHPTSGTSSPLPAPAARRNGRQSVADALAAESSKPSSPAVETPSTSVAPWAAQASEGTHKQPSLKEIQEAEARRAAKREEEQASIRRAALERELANQPIAPAPGLPSSSTWANTEGVTSPSAAGPSAWAKANTKTVATPGGSKKTLQQIQKEEEALAKKQKAATAAATSVHGNTASGASSVAQAVSAGKRYADLAGRAPAPASGASGAWTTVGAGGKVKTPITPTPPNPSRTTTSGLLNNLPASTTTKRPPGLAHTNSSASTITAYDEFKKWAVGELRSDLNKGVDGMFIS